MNFDLEQIKRLAIVAMFSDDDLMDRLVLKGGNLLDLVYKVSTRASVDVDLSIDGNFSSIEELRRKIEASLTSVYQENGLVPFDIHVSEVPPNLTEDMRPFWGGYKIVFKLIEVTKFASAVSDDQRRRRALQVGNRGSSKFSIDLSAHEYCGDKRRMMLDGLTIFVYSPAMIVSEKIRAICQQMPVYVGFTKRHPSARARDFVDIHVTSESFGISFDNEFRQVLRSVFEAKRVPLSLIGEIAGTREFHRPDFAAVKDTVKAGVTLRDFDYYFDYVVRRCRELESLGNE